MEIFKRCREYMRARKPYDPVAYVNGNELSEVVQAVRFASVNNPRLSRHKRWRLAMLANALEKRSL